MKATVTKLPALAMTQDPSLTAETTQTTWYGFIDTYGLAWDRESFSGRLGAAEYSCVVTLPSLTMGDAEEVRSDVVAALNRHAGRLGVLTTLYPDIYPAETEQV